MRFHGIIFNVTYDCDLDCPHCFYYRPDTPGRMLSASRVAEIIASTRDVAPVTEVHFTGGEPFLYFDELLEMVAASKRLGAVRITCSTNASWATSDAVARDRVSRLVDAGLTWFLISADAFHQERVPLDNALRLADVRRERIDPEAGPQDLSVVCFVNKDYPHPFNDRTLAIARQIAAAGHSSSLHPSMPYGRGCELIPAEACTMTEPHRRCWEWRTWGFIHPKGPWTVFIGPDENVNVCYGVSLGHLRDASLLELLRQFDEAPNPIVRTLLTDGPAGLARRAAAYGWQPDEPFLNECHLCYRVRSFLRRFEPQHLQPDACYPRTSRPAG